MQRQDKQSRTKWSQERAEPSQISKCANMLWAKATAKLQRRKRRAFNIWHPNPNVHITPEHLFGMWWVTGHCAETTSTESLDGAPGTFSRMNLAFLLWLRVIYGNGCSYRIHLWTSVNICWWTTLNRGSGTPSRGYQQEKEWFPHTEQTHGWWVDTNDWYRPMMSSPTLGAAITSGAVCRHSAEGVACGIPLPCLAELSNRNW